MTTEPVHHLSRELHGRWVVFPLPLCWEADARSRGPVDDEDWWTAWDQGALDPTALVFATTPTAVTCPDCVSWIHA